MPPHPRAPDAADAFGKEVEAAQAELAQDIAEAGPRGDPYATLLSALTEMLGLFPASLCLLPLYVGSPRR